MEKALDFTKGNVWKKMIAFSWPIFLTNLLQTSYQIIDSLWVGNLLGATALGAISISTVVIFTVLSFIIGVNQATLTVLSQQRGKKDEEGLKKSLNAFVVVLFSLSIIVGILGIIFTGPILRLLQTPENILPLAKTYLYINFIGIVFLFGYNFIGTVLRALGDSRTPIYFVLAAVILNAVLDPVFIVAFGWGMEGAAAATVVSQGIAFIYGMAYSLIKAKAPFIKPYAPEKKYVKMIMKLGIPSGLQMIAISGGSMAIMSTVTVFGEHAVAGFGAAQRLDSVIMLPAMTLGSAVTSMAGQNIGANKWERVTEIAKLGIYLILVVMTSISLFIFILSEHLVRLFVDDLATIAFGAMYVKMIAFFYPFLGINFVLNGIVRAAGAMFQVLALNIISLWMLRYPLSKICSLLFGEIGIPLGMGISLIISSLLAFIYFRFGKWKQLKV